MPPCLPASLPVCQPVFLSAYLSTCQPACLSVWQCLPACMNVTAPSQFSPWLLHACVCECVCFRPSVCQSCLHSFIHSFILNIYIAPLQENYSETLPTPARLNRAVLRWEKSSLPSFSPSIDFCLLSSMKAWDGWQSDASPSVSIFQQLSL